MVRRSRACWCATPSWGPDVVAASKPPEARRLPGRSCRSPRHAPDGREGVGVDGAILERSVGGSGKPVCVRAFALGARGLMAIREECSQELRIGRKNERISTAARSVRVVGVR